jgi:hypothetical protein
MSLNGGASALDSKFEESLPDHPDKWKGDRPRLLRNTPDPKRFNEIHADLSERGYRPTHRAVMSSSNPDEIHHEYYKPKVVKSSIGEEKGFMLKHDDNYPRKFAIERKNGQHAIRYDEE